MSIWVLSLTKKNKTSYFSITEGSIIAITVSSIKVKQNVNKSISPVIPPKLIKTTSKRSLNATPEPRIKHKQTEQIIYDVQAPSRKYLWRNFTKSDKNIWWKKNFITNFDKVRTKLKASKTSENLEDHRNVNAEIELKPICREDTLKVKLHELEMKFLQETDSNSIYANTGSANFICKLALTWMGFLGIRFVL